MVKDTGEWDWKRLQGLLPQHVLDLIAAEMPPVTDAGPDIPGWRCCLWIITTVSSGSNLMIGFGETCLTLPDHSMFQKSGRGNLLFFVGSYGIIDVVVSWGRIVYIVRNCLCVGICCLKSVYTLFALEGKL
ncbi:hypothetical protein V6N13_143067 [Hibiscus sabdariffa]